MVDWVRRALTRKIRRKGTRKRSQVIIVEANEKLVLLVKFSIGMTVCLSAVEIAYIVVLRSWSSEIFTGIAGLIGTVTGVLIGNRA